MDFMDKSWEAAQKVENLISARAHLVAALDVIDGCGLFLAANHLSMSIELIDTEIKGLKAPGPHRPE